MLLVFIVLRGARGEGRGARGEGSASFGLPAFSRQGKGLIYAGSWKAVAQKTSSRSVQSPQSFGDQVPLFTPAASHDTHV